MALLKEGDGIVLDEVALVQVDMALLQVGGSVVGGEQ